MTRPWLNTLGLAPLLGASHNLRQGLALGMLMLLIVALHRLAMAPLRARFDEPGRLLASITLAAALVSCSLIALQAWALPLSLELGIYPGLIALQCLLFELTLGRPATWRPVLALLCGHLLALSALGLVRQGLGAAGLGLAQLLPGALLLLALSLALITRARTRRAAPDREGSR